MSMGKSESRSFECLSADHTEITASWILFDEGLPTAFTDSSDASSEDSAPNSPDEPEAPLLPETAPLEFVLANQTPVGEGEALSSLVPILRGIHNQLLTQTKLLEQLAEKPSSISGKSKIKKPIPWIEPERGWSK